MDIAQLASSLTKEQLGLFLGIAGPSKRLSRTIHKEALLQQLLLSVESNPAEKDRFFDAFKEELAVPPWELEALLSCTSTERKRWTADGKLPVLSYRQFRKAGRYIDFPMYDRLFVLSISQETLGKWRTEHQALVGLRRRTGIQKAVASRSEHQQVRATFQAQWKSLIEEWTRHGPPDLAAILQLAYWTTISSRLAKFNQLKALKAIKHQALYLRRKDEWYQRKNRAIQLLAQTPYAHQAFYRPEEPDKISLTLCDEHYELKRELYYETKWDFYNDFSQEIRGCPQCEVDEERDYYSLYYLEIAPQGFPGLHFSFHTPYPLGKALGLPKPGKLPKVEHEEQEAFFRFGRPLLPDEQIIYREREVQEHFEEALACVLKFFPQKNTENTGQSDKFSRI